MKLTLIIAMALLLAASGIARAQEQAPFDMSPERSEQDAAPGTATPDTSPTERQAAPAPAPVEAPPSAEPAPREEPRPAIEPQPAAPSDRPAAAPAAPSRPSAPAAPPAGSPAPNDQGPKGEPQAVAPDSAPKPVEPESDQADAGKPASQDAKRFLVPFERLTLAGEQDHRAWTIHLTEEQASAKTTVHLGYQNAVVVAPEISRLTLKIDDRKVIEEPLRSSEGTKEIVVDIPAGTFKPGSNTVAVDVVQRHRTDCTIQSTYELWTEIDPKLSYIAFPDPEALALHRPADLAAIGTDAEGRTQFDIVVPALDSAATTAPVMFLAQGLALASDMPTESFNVTKTAPGVAGPGRLTVVMGTAAEVAQVLGRTPAGAEVSPMVTFVDDAKTNGSTMVVTGPTWPAIETAVDSITKPFDRALDTPRAALSTRNWLGQDVPLFLDSGAKSFRELGTRTQQFAGRRFRTTFSFGIPADFYANAYGEAKVLLDAAYSPAVLPGSHIDIYVNGQITATMPITQNGGAILRKMPIPVTMRHFHPGENELTVEVILLTRADSLCVPGTTAGGDPRFVLFDTSRFVMPDFARVATRPDLSALAGTGFPYSRSAEPIPLLLGRNDPDLLSAAANLLARMAMNAGRPIHVDTTATAATVANRNAIFVEDAASISPTVLSSVGLVQNLPAIWHDGAGSGAEKTDDEATAEAFEQWRKDLAGRGWSGSVSRFQNWLGRNFDLTMESLQLVPRKAPDYSPPRTSGLVVAQGLSPDGGKGTWTLLTAPTAAALKKGVQSLAADDQWQEVAGRIVTLDADDESVHVLPVADYSFDATQPPSLWNYRLIAANWLSANILSYLSALFVACLILGTVTAAFLSSLGRHSGDR